MIDLAGLGLLRAKEQAKKLETANALRKENADQAIQGDRQAPPVGGDGSPGPAGNVGGYNSGWLDPGSTFTVVKGEIRASIAASAIGASRVKTMSPGIGGHLRDQYWPTGG